MSQIQHVTPVRHVLFDLGVVLVQIDYRSALERAIKLCDPPRATNATRFFSHLQRDPSITQFETGLITAKAFYQRFVKLTGFRGDFDAFAALWRDIFIENGPMVRFARAVASQYNTYILSNASDLHVPYLFEAFPSLQFAKGWIASYEIQVMKPAIAYYEQALARFGLEPDHCLFIDDKAENVDAALGLGIPSILYTTPEETITAMRQRLDTIFSDPA